MQGTGEQTQDGTVAPAPGGVLRRLIAANRRPDSSPPMLPRPPARSLERTISAAVSRAANHSFGLALFFDRVVAAQMQLAELIEYLPERALICLVEGPGDSLGVVSICPGFLASIIEMQAMGQVSTRVTQARRPTRTDAAICADFVNACLAELDGDLAAMPGYAMMRGFRYAGFLPDPRPLDLMLDDRPYRRLEVNIRAGDAGQRDGVLTVVLPIGVPSASLAAPMSRHAAATDQGTAATPSMGTATASPVASALEDSPVMLHGVLCRRQVGLRQLRALLAGQPISLPRSVLDNATLETVRGQVLARGKLGESEGRHALRLYPTHPAREARGPDDAVDVAQARQGVDFDLSPADHGLPDPFRPDQQLAEPNPDEAAMPPAQRTGEVRPDPNPTPMQMFGD